MAQYIDKSALLAEIKERIETYNKGYANGDDSRADALEVLLHDIDSLQEEPVSEDFENALAEEWKGYNDRGAAKVDALEDNTQELAFAKGFYRGWHYKKEEPVSEDLPHIRHRDTLDEFAYQCAYDMSNDWAKETPTWHDVEMACKLGANWQKANLLKPADGDDLPEYDREVIAILDYDFGHYKVVYAHRPPEYWDGKNIITGEVTRYYPKTYDNGGWNIPNIKYWLDVELPKEIEL